MVPDHRAARLGSATAHPSPPTRPLSTPTPPHGHRVAQADIPLCNHDPLVGLDDVLSAMTMTRGSIFDLMIGVPSDCSGEFAGCERMPAALRSHGLADSLGVIDAGNLQVVVADPVRDRETGVI